MWSGIEVVVVCQLFYHCFSYNSFKYFRNVTSECNKFWLLFIFLLLWKLGWWEQGFCLQVYLQYLAIFSRVCALVYWIGSGGGNMQANHLDQLRNWLIYSWELTLPFTEKVILLIWCSSSDFLLKKVLGSSTCLSFSGFVNTVLYLAHLKKAVGSSLRFLFTFSSSWIFCCACVVALPFSLH